MKVDMSPRAVRDRLELVGQIWRLGISLGKAKRDSDARRRENEAASGATKKENSQRRKIE